MCYNIAFLEKRMDRYDERYGNVLPPDITQRMLQKELPLYFFVSGFSHPVMPIVKSDGIFLYEWGLIPFWNKTVQSAIEIQSKTLNAVGETIFEKPSYRKSILSKRCLLGISGFFEWRDVNKVKYPYFIKTKDNNIFSLGCIYDNWTDTTTGEIKNTFSIITTAANPLMETIHNLKKRMPLIIAPEDEMKWIEPSLTKQEIAKLIKPYDEKEMTAYTVSKRINNARNDRNVAENLYEVDYPELTSLHN